MAVANTKSAAVQANEAIPRTFVADYLSSAGGTVRCAVETVEVAAADSDASVYRMMQIPSNAVILRMEPLNDAITGGTSYDIGLYHTKSKGGAAVDANLFATVIDMAVARTLPFDVMFETLDINKVGKQLWELLGLTADPQVIYEICFTANTVGSSAGTLSMRVFWTN